MKQGPLISICVLAVVTGWVVSIFVRHEDRTLGRLVRSGVVADETHVELLHSTGYRRENTHVFRVPFKELTIKGEAFDLESESLREWVTEIRKMVEPHDPGKTVDWEKAVVYEMDDPHVLATVTVVKARDEQAFVVLKIF